MLSLLFFWQKKIDNVIIFINLTYADGANLDPYIVLFAL